MVVLRFLLDLSEQQAAAEPGWPVGTVGTVGTVDRERDAPGGGKAAW